MIAHDIASSPELYHVIVKFSPHGKYFECLGYTGKMIKFARLEVQDSSLINGHTITWNIKQITRYVYPETTVYLEKECIE